MIGITRGISTLIGAAVAGFLIWLAVQLGTDTAGAYWATYGLVAAAGLTMALSQLLGGWTKWGWPRVSLGVFLLGFLPVLLLGGWVLLARQPADFFNTSNWSRDLGVHGAVSDLGELLAALAFAIGLTFGFTFDTAGPRREVVGDHERRREREPVQPDPAAATMADRRPAHRDGVEQPEGRRTETGATPADSRWEKEREAADEPLTAERSERAGEVEQTGRARRFGLRRRLGSRRRDES